ncbi:hypothetical protein [Methylobacterium sp. JK268]
MGEFGGLRKGGRGTAAVGGSTALGYFPLLPTLSVIACLAAGSLYWRDAPAHSPAGQAAVPAPLPPSDPFPLALASGEGWFRAPFPLEFEEHFPLLAAAPPTAPLVGPTCDPVPTLPARDRLAQQQAEPRPAARRQAGRHRAPLPLLAGVRPPPRPDALRFAAAEPPPQTPIPLAPVTPAPAQTPAPEDKPRLRLPHVVRTGREVVRTVVALGDGVVQAGSAMLDLIDSRP